MNDMAAPVLTAPALAQAVMRGERRAIAQAINLIERNAGDSAELLDALRSRVGRAYRIGVTGPPGAGKSTLVARLAAALRRRGQSVAVIAVDPTSPFSGGALLGDRVRMSEIWGDDRVFIRSMAAREALGGLAAKTIDVADILDAAAFDVILLETVGVGQSELDVAQAADTTVVMLTPESGDEVQAAKAGLMEIAEVFVLNKCDRPGSDRAFAAIRAMLNLRSRDLPPRRMVGSAGQSRSRTGQRRRRHARRDRCAPRIPAGEPEAAPAPDRSCPTTGAGPGGRAGAVWRRAAPVDAGLRPACRTDRGRDRFASHTCRRFVERSRAMSLEERIAAFRSKFLSQVPEEIQHLMRGAEVRLEESGAALRAMKTGDRAPGFDLPNAHGETVSSRELLARGPVVLSFYRGDWCPYCNLELKALQERVAEIEALGARLVAVSPQTPDATTDTATRNKLTFEVLSDTGNTVAKSFGLDFELAEELRPIYKNWGADLEKLNGDPPFSLPMAATYVIGSDGTIIESFVDTDYTERMEPQAIIDALKR